MDYPIYLTTIITVSPYYNLSNMIFGTPSFQNIFVCFVHNNNLRLLLKQYLLYKQCYCDNRTLRVAITNNYKKYTYYAENKETNIFLTPSTASYKHFRITIFA